MNARPPRPVIRIGLWGAPGSGKTTFLAALRTAALLGSENGTWTMMGADDEASEFLTRMTDILVHQRQFPPASQGITPLSWRFIGDLRSSRLAERILARGSDRVEFLLELQDVAGRYFADDAGFEVADDGDLPEDDWMEIVRHLARCDGLVYLFDPVRELERGDSYRFFQGTLERLSRQAYDWGLYKGPRLPHHLAVCVTKFDHPRIFSSVMAEGFVTQDSYGSQIPRIDGERAGAFFTWLCQGMPGNAELVRKSIEAYFDSNRVAYFATSSVGFWTRPGGMVDTQDCHNVETVDGMQRIRGAVRPVNVLEPMVWLQRRIRSVAGR
jgi:hypothetical protein